MLIPEYLSGLPSADDRKAFAVRCGTSLEYLRLIASGADGRRFRESLCIAIERESAGAVTCEELRPDVDWAYLRGTAKPLPADPERKAA